MGGQEYCPEEVTRKCCITKMAVPPSIKTASSLVRKCVGGVVVGVSLSEPHTSGTALQKCVCMYLCLRPYTINVKCAFKYFPKIDEHPCALSQ